MLRRWRPDDVDQLTKIYASPAIVAWLGALTHSDAAATVARYEHHWEMHGFGRFAVEDRRTGQLVGRVGVMRQPDWVETPHKDEVGWVVRADRWAEGLATEAAHAAIADALDRVGLACVLSWTLPENIASRRVMEKCGLGFRGTADWNGQPHVWYASDEQASD